MDDIVKQAMAKWPNVPNVYGWLSLDLRGNWRLKGEVIANPAITAFINRNYEHDAAGRWFFQNGPQRVFVALACAPYVFRVAAGSGEPQLEANTGAAVRSVSAAWFDDDGVLLLETDRGVGSVDDRDLERLLACFTDAAGRALDEDRLAARIEALQSGADAGLRFRYRGGDAPVEAIAAAAVAEKFGFVREPARAGGEEACD